VVAVRVTSRRELRAEAGPPGPGMSRRCERPGCSAPATVAFGFSTERLLAWLAPLGDADRNAVGALCERHADAMAPPRGWWLDDRRIDEPTLFRAPEHKPEPLERRGSHAHADDARRRPARRSHELVIGEQLALDAEVVGQPADPTEATGADDGDEAGAAATTGVAVDQVPGGDDRPDADDSAHGGSAAPMAEAEPAVEPWTPSFDVSDDLGGLLDVSTPLLARAFGRDRRSTTPPAPRG